MWRCIKPWDPDVYVRMGVRFREESSHQHPFYQEYLYSNLYSRCKSDKPMQQMEDRIDKLQTRKSWFRWWDLCSIMLLAKDSPPRRFSSWTQKTNQSGKLGVLNPIQHWRGWPLMMIQCQEYKLSLIYLWSTLIAYME